MRIAFLGTPLFAAELLATVHAEGHHIAMVYTQPSRRSGRGQAMRPTPVQQAAERLSLPVRTPPSMRDPEEIRAFQDLGVDAGVVVAFGQILTADVLDAPRLGCFNVHASLLPRWRGAAPIQRAIMAGDERTGVQVMRMSVGLDEGAVVATAEVQIGPEDTAASLQAALLVAAKALLPPALASIENGTSVDQPQPDEGMTYARKIRALEARIDWSKASVEVDRAIRGLSPYPGAWFELPTSKGPVRVKALLSRNEVGAGLPGQILDSKLLIACGSGAVRLLRLQRPGGKAQHTDDFVRGLENGAEVRFLA